MNTPTAPQTADAVRRGPKKGPRTPKPGFSISEAFPAIAAEWDTEANHPLTPADVTLGSGFQAVWICPEGHPPYKQRVEMRTQRKNGCPECGRAKTAESNRRRSTTIHGFGRSLAEAFPDVAAEWDYEANHPMTPATVGSRSNKKAYFICPKGHGSYEACISNRTAGNGCPDCGRRRSGNALRARAVSRGTLAETNPALAAEWNIELNTITPDEVSCGTDTKAWWNCAEGHDPFLAPVSRRHKGQRCPVCANISRAKAIAYKGPKPGTSLAEKRPDLIPEWDTTRNTLTPYDLAAGSSKTVHWVCPDGHRYKRSIANRVAISTCPVHRRNRTSGQPVAA